MAAVVASVSDHLDVRARIDVLRSSYAEIGGPTPDQWESLASIPADRPVTLVNLFAFRDVANYADANEPAVTGHEAFSRYSAVSAPALDAVGGRFVHLGSHHGTLVGDDESWDLIVVGEYPSLDALLALHEDPAYREAYRHRVAACSRQRVLVSG